MSTRCQIGFYDTGETDLTKWGALLYRHCDGYPEGMIPDLQPFLGEYKRDLSDAEELSAKCLMHFGKVNPSNLYCICKGFHGDIKYFYAVFPDRLDVYSVSNSAPSRWNKIYELKIGEIPAKYKDEDES